MSEDRAGTSRRVYRERVTPERAGTRLDGIVRSVLERVELNAAGRGRVRGLIASGAVRVDRRVCTRPHLRVAAGVEIEVSLERSGTASERVLRPFAHGFDLTEEHVRFEDDLLLVVSKPEGLPTHATVDPLRAHLYGAVQRYLARHGHDYAGLHHRLDVDTSGLVLFTKTPQINAHVAAWFREHRIEKTYWAWVERPAEGLPGAWRVENYLGPRGSKPTRYGAVRAGGSRAITDFCGLPSRARDPSIVLIEAKPRTGRAHQIRVHLAEDGKPILGDRLYGGSSASRLMLHARALQFLHPHNGKGLEVVDPPPASFLEMAHPGSGCVAPQDGR